MILRNLNLDEKHDVIAYQNVMDEDEEDDGDGEVRVFICFSNPHGKVPLLVSVFVFVAWICSFWSIQGCKFVLRSTIINFTNGTIVPGKYDMSAGMWSYNLIDEFEPNDFEGSPFCQPYPLQLHNVDSNWVMAKAAAALANLVGFIGIGIAMSATSIKLKKRSFIALCIMMIISCIFGGLQFLFLHSMICNEWYDPHSNDIVSATCSLDRDGYAAVAAVVLWFVALLGSGVMVYTYN